MPFVKYNEKKYAVKDNYLDLKFKEIKDITLIEGLEKLTYLEALNLRNNQITEINGLGILSKLKRLYLNENRINKIKGLEKLQSLEILNLSGNQITKIEGLDKLQNLESLDLMGNQITKIEGLDALQIFYSHKPDIIVFPENSIPQSKIKSLEKFSKTNDLIIIGGLEHIKEQNEFINKVIIIDKGRINEQIKQTPVWI